MPDSNLDQWFARNKSVLEDGYTSHEEPWRQSGFSGPEARWINLRKPIADCIDQSGTFLDIGCANGYLLECCLRWTAERDIHIVPYGLDFSEKLVELAKARLPQFEDHFYVGNALYWKPPQAFDFVRTGLEYVPGDYEKQYISFLLKHHVKVNGKLLIAHGGEGSADPGKGNFPGSHATKHILERLRELGFEAVDHKDGYDPIKGRKTQVAIIHNG
ncbi:MAG: class I SAM-dependent methyltransferase [Chloroflexota bacterium]